MEKFAKVFETHGRQFLVMKNTNDDGDPKLSIITRIEDAEIDFGIVFPEEKEDAMNVAFDVFDVEALATIGKKIEHAKSSFEVFQLLTSE